MFPDAERLAALVSFSKEAVVLADETGTIQWASPSSATVLGYEPEELVGVRTESLITPEELDGGRSLDKDLQSRPGASGTGQFRCRHGDGSPRWTEADVRNLLGEPSVRATVITYRDVTATRMAEHSTQALRLAEA